MDKHQIADSQRKVPGLWPRLWAFMLILFLSACSQNGETTNNLVDDESVVSSASSTEDSFNLTEETPGLTPRKIPTWTPTLMPPTPTKRPPALEINPRFELPTYGTCPGAFELTVAYIKDNDVWLWTEEVGAIQLTDSSDAHSVEISGDSCLIAYGRNVPNPGYEEDIHFSWDQTIFEMWLVDRNMNTNRRLVGYEFLKSLPAENFIFFNELAFSTWRPNSYTLAFSTSAVDPGFFSPNDDLHFVDASTGEITTLLKAEEGGRFYFSPNGRQLSITTIQSLGLINGDGTDYRTNILVYGVISTYSDANWFHAAPYWNKNSDAIIVAIPPKDYQSDRANSVTTIWQIPLDGSEAIEVGTLRTTWEEHYYSLDLSFSPDLTKVAYLFRLDDNYSTEGHDLVIASTDNLKEFVRIHDVTSRLGSWAPD